MPRLSAHLGGASVWAEREDCSSGLEGKSMAGLIDLVTSGDIPGDAAVLYAHLGDQPALNAYSGLFTEGRRAAS